MSPHFERYAARELRSQRLPAPRAALRVRSDPPGTRWLVWAAAVLCLLCCGLVWAAPAPLPSPRERVGTGIQLNGVRNFAITDATDVYLDGVLYTGPVTRERVGTGMRVRGVVGADGNAQVTAGTLDLLFLDHEVLGPVTSLQPFAVLGQVLAVNGDTVLEGLLDVGALQVGNIVAVSAYTDPNGSAVASLIGLRPQPVARWRMTGRLNQLNLAASEATLGSQPIRFVGVSPQGCNTPLAVGRTVSVRATAVPGFVPGQRIDTVTELRCEPGVPFGTAGGNGALEAVVSTVNASGFTLGDLQVDIDTQTVFVQGAPDDLAPGVRVEAAGTFLAPGQLLAERVTFIQPLVRVEAPLNPADVAIGSQLSMLGEIFRANPQTRDDDAVYAGGLSAPRQVQVRAYVDRNGQPYALRVRIRGNTPAPDQIELTGLVHNVTASTFQILGITVLTGAGTVFLDELEQPITAATFFAAMVPGAEAEVLEATYNSSTRELTPAIVQIHLRAPPPLRLGPTRGSALPAPVQGTVSGFTSDHLLYDSFEDGGR